MRSSRLSASTTGIQRLTLLESPDVARGDGTMLYDDGRIACDDSSLIIRVYYLWGAAKTIPYSAIRDVERCPLTGLTGKWRIWGSGDFVHYWNLDTKRPGKQTALEIDVGKRVVPMITPDDPDAVERILRERINSRD